MVGPEMKGTWNTVSDSLFQDSSFFFLFVVRDNTLLSSLFADFGSLSVPLFTSLSPCSSLVPVGCVWWRWGWMTGWGKMGPERFLLLLLVRCAWWHSSFFSLQILVLFCFTSLVERCFSSFFFSILLIRGLTWIRFFYLPDLAHNCVLSPLVPVVVIKAKGTRNFVLSYFVPVVGIKAKGTMELGEFRNNCCACCAWWHNGLRVVTLLSVRGDTIICACLALWRQTSTSSRGLSPRPGSGRAGGVGKGSAW